jgi:hypothetical protein
MKELTSCWLDLPSTMPQERTGKESVLVLSSARDFLLREEGKFQRKETTEEETIYIPLRPIERCERRS